MTTTVYLLFLLLFCLFAQGFFSMFEMAAVSFNKVRLEYYVGQNKRRALWLNALLKNPSRLFGTTLILVNTFLQCGSEISRKLYESLGINPVFAPFSQILLVLIFAELAPMFAARRHPEHVAFLYIPVVIFFTQLLKPIIWLIDHLNRFLQHLFGQKKEMSLFLSREELQKAFEETQESTFDEIIGRFFTMKHLQAEDVMVALSCFAHISSHSTIFDVRTVLQKQYFPFVFVYHQKASNIIGIAYVRDLLIAKDTQKILDFVKSPWFIVEKDRVFEILAQFRRNNQTVAIVLKSCGKPVGVVTLTILTDRIFGSKLPFLEESTNVTKIHFEKTVCADMSLAEFNHLFHTVFPEKDFASFSDYMISTIGHHPVKGEVIRLENLEITVLETSMFSIKVVSVKTLN